MVPVNVKVAEFGPVASQTPTPPTVGSMIVPSEVTTLYVGISVGSLWFRTTIQVPTNACPASDVGVASWAATRLVALASANPSPPAPSPARADRRETA